MLTAKQEIWLSHLSDTDLIVIVPFDPSAEEKFQVVRQRIQGVLGPEVPVEHHGASRLRISGQDEIDIYVPVPPARFDELYGPLEALFGKPKSSYPLERVHFTTVVDGKHVDVFLMNAEHEGWTTGVAFEEYLLAHPEELERYRVLKEEGNGLSCRQYYRRKNEFINEILEKSRAELV